MLKELHIRNYAIIDSAKLEFTPGLTIITGETGAGKSILLGALKLILGERADTKLLYDPSKKCVIEAVFDTQELALQSFFDRHDLDWEDPLIIRREILPSGKSRAFVNDTPVTLQPLKELGIQLVEMHQQFDTVALFQEAFQRAFLDRTGKTEELYADYLETFQSFQKKNQEIKTLKSKLENAEKERSFLEFQLAEIEELQPEPGEEESLMLELKALENAREIIEVLSQLHFDALESETSLLAILRQHERLLSGIAPYVQELPELQKRLDTSLIEIEDIYRQCALIASGIQEDPVAFQSLSNRYDQLQSLLRKHGLISAAQLVELKENLQRQLETLSSDSHHLKAMEAALTTLQKRAKKSASKLSAARKKALPEVIQSLEELLKKLGMPEAKIDLRLTPVENLNTFGLEHISLLFSANKGIPPRPVKEIASGGELSRLNLCIKSMMADVRYMPTLIFDEIDTGISGAIAKNLGQMLHRLSLKHQLISITHAPIVAAFGQTQLEVFKDHSGDKTRSAIRLLNEEARILEIAKMMSGDPPSPAAIKNAKELLLLRTGDKH